MTLPDTIAACNYIKCRRRLSRKLKRKSIRIDFDNDEKLCTRLGVSLNPSTGVVSLAHCLRYERLSFYPTTNQRLRCTNQHALDVLQHARDSNKEYQRNRRKERI